MEPVTGVQLSAALHSIMLATALGAAGASLITSRAVELVREIYRYHWARRRAARIRRMRFQQAVR